MEGKLKELIKQLRDGISNKNLEETLMNNPQLILPLRLALGLSQKEFIRYTSRLISQVTLVKYETGKANKMKTEIAKKLAKKFPKPHIDEAEVIKNYKKFLIMKKGSLTSERARELQQLWMMKTTQDERKNWGRIGAKKTNEMQRFNPLERSINRILQKYLPNGYQFKSHQSILTDIGEINIDFVIYKNHHPTGFIEASMRKYDLDILIQAYAYRRIILKRKFPTSWFIIIIQNEIPKFGEEVLKKEFDRVFKIHEERLFIEFIKSLPFIQQT